ncbi:MAG TPA: flagellin [bacterium]|nr:flagellin [bacterium]HOL48778.1 flagellin [bacterium]HPQ19733.1 flagellin [bacterium]
MKINEIGRIVSVRKVEENTNLLGKQIQKLTSFQRITSASDDAAGLAIATRITSQIGGLNQAQYNVQDTTSLIQVAEGGISQINDMQQRLRELAVQASNGTLTDADRQMINAEAQQLKEEINRMAGTVEFNGMKLLNGDFEEGTGDLQVQAGANENQTIKINIKAMNTTALGINDIDLSTANGATAAISAIDNSINITNEQRSNLGAITNRLNSTYNFLGVEQINQTSSFAQIMEADVAQEMLTFTSKQLLRDVGLAMLTQGNLQRRNVLSLITA